MSRMLAAIAASPATAVDMIGAALRDEFAQLSHLHADGCASAHLDENGTVTRRLAVPVPTLGRDEHARAHLLYLRFASAGAPASAENSQPFVRDNAAFAHNGLLSPRDALLSILTRPDMLTGSTDSEAYAALVHEQARLPRGDKGARSMIDALAAAAARLRTIYPEACLNAVLLTPAGLHVVYSPGAGPAPLAAFAQRGHTAPNLPPEHDDASYNLLKMTELDSRGGTTHVVATSGINRHGWSELPRDTVTLVPGSGSVRHVAL